MSRKAGMAQERDAFRTFTAQVHGQNLSYAARPDLAEWEHPDDGTLALAEAMEIQPGDRVLDLACGAGLVGVAAARLASRGQVWLADSHLVAIEAAQRTLVLNSLANASVSISDGALAFAGREFDVVTIHLPRGKAVAEEYLRHAHTALRPDGRLYFVAHKLSGGKGYVDLARMVFGAAVVVKIKSGYRVALSRRGAEAAGSMPEDYCEFSGELGSQTVHWIAKPGVFSWDEIDRGTQTLVEHMQIQPGERVLDLGCAAGLVGLVAARQTSPAGQVTLVDVDIRAVESARRTMQRNSIANAIVLLSDVGSAVANQTFDVVLANPPFHQRRETEYSVGVQFVFDSAQVLRPGGRLYLVANRFLDYEHPLHQTFGGYEKVFEDKQYKVLKGTKVCLVPSI